MSKIFQLRSIHSMRFFLTYWQQSFHDAIMKFSSCLTSSSIPWFLNMHDYARFTTTVIHMMTSWHGKFFQIAGPLWGESIGRRWTLFLKSNKHGILMFSLLLAWTSRWTNDHIAGDLMHHTAHLPQLQLQLFPGWDIVCLKKFDTFTRTPVRVSKMNAVARAQLTFQMLTLF